MGGVPEELASGEFDARDLIRGDVIVEVALGPAVLVVRLELVEVPLLHVDGEVGPAVEYLKRVFVGIETGVARNEDAHLVQGLVASELRPIELQRPQRRAGFGVDAHGVAGYGRAAVDGDGGRPRFVNQKVDVAGDVTLDRDLVGAGAEIDHAREGGDVGSAVEVDRIVARSGGDRAVADERARDRHGVVAAAEVPRIQEMGGRQGEAVVAVAGTHARVASESIGDIDGVGAVAEIPDTAESRGIQGETVVAAPGGARAAEFHRAGRGQGVVAAAESELARDGDVGETEGVARVAGDDVALEGRRAGGRELVDLRTEVEFLFEGHVLEGQGVLAVAAGDLILEERAAGGADGVAAAAEVEYPFESCGAEIQGVVAVAKGDRLFEGRGT